MLPQESELKNFKIKKDKGMYQNNLPCICESCHIIMSF